MRRLLLLSALSLAMSTTSLAQAPASSDGGYQQPHAPIAQILDSKPTAASLIDPTRTRLALLERANLPSIAELAEPDLKLPAIASIPATTGRPTAASSG
jgi:hypothetical protein